MKLSGTLSGARLPKPAAGVSLVQAFNVGDGSIAASDYLDRRGRFSMKVPPGPYALVGGSVFFKRGLPTVKLVGALRARSGKSRRLPLSLRRARGAATAGAARRVGVADFSGGAPYQNRGLAAMIVTDLVMLNGGPPCAFTVLELQKRDEIIREIRRQQTKFFDPATRVRPGQLLQPTLVVRGSLVPHGGDDVSYSLRVVNARNGRVKGTVSGRTGSGWITASGGIARELAKIICEPDDLYFRVVGYTRSEQSNTSRGQRTAADTLFGGPGPVAKLPECTNPPNCLKAFVLEGRVTSVFTGNVTGTASPFGCPGGAFDYGTSSIQNPLRQGVAFDPEGTAPATAGAGAIPEVGDVIEDKCGAHDYGEAQPLSASVPADDLLSGNPVTFTFSGSGSVPSSGDHPGIPITWMLSESMTVQRVKADGSHL